MLRNKEYNKKYIYVRLPCWFSLHTFPFCLGPGPVRNWICSAFPLLARPELVTKAITLDSFFFFICTHSVHWSEKIERRQWGRVFLFASCWLATGTKRKRNLQKEKQQLWWVYIWRDRVDTFPPITGPPPSFASDKTAAAEKSRRLAPVELIWPWPVVRRWLTRRFPPIR